MTERRVVREAGDSALVVELEPVIDPRVNATAIGVARSIARCGLAGVRDVVPTFRSVAVHFDRLVAHAADIRTAIERALSESAAEAAGPLVEVPVVYGGDEGPDLEDVAKAAGLTPDAVIERHAASEYRVYMLGFLPGFAYMGAVDPAIVSPRRSTPRLAVRAGSVGIAGWQTGVYPCESPGGWQIIGRTPMRVFDAGRTPPCVFAPGDRVRFVPVGRARAQDEVRLKPDTTYGDDDVRLKPDATYGDDRVRLKPDATYGDDEVRLKPDPTQLERSVTVLTPGLLTTIQDDGRWGHQHQGVPVSGAMDVCSHRVANVLVGNDADAATLEVTIVGPDLRMEANAMIAVAGADFELSLDGVRIPANAPVSAPAGSVLRFGRRRTGGRAYVAFGGGLAVPQTLGSRATHVRSRMGGLEGRALRAGDRLPLGRPGLPRSRTGEPLTLPSGGARLRVLPGPQDDCFPPSALDVLTSTRFVVAPDSDRMGFRLAAACTIPRHAGPEMISDATMAGGVQVPASGDPILLMADRPTTGGYPQMAVVISADLPVAGQLVPGDWVEFEVCSMAQAIAALSSQRGRGRDSDLR